MHALVHQRVGCVQQALHGRLTVAFLAFHDIVAGEFQIVQDAVRVRPLLEQVVVLEEVVVTERRVRNHQRLHRRGVLFHDVADAGVGVDDDLVRQPLHARPVERLIASEVLAERPVLVEQRHADGGISVEHLLGADDLDLVRIGVETQLLLRDHLDRIVAALDRREFPVRPFKQRAFCADRYAHAGTASEPCFLAKSSRNTG